MSRYPGVEGNILPCGEETIAAPITTYVGGKHPPLRGGNSEFLSQKRLGPETSSPAGRKPRQDRQA